MTSNPERINKLISFVKDELDPTMTMTRLQLFLEVGMHEGITTVDLGKKLGMFRSTLNKNIRTLARYLEFSTGYVHWRGFELIQFKRDKDNHARRACFLTKKGTKVYSEVTNIMKGNSKTAWCFDKIKKLMLG